MIEPEGGSPLRRMHPFATGASGNRHSLLWEYVAANKRSIRQSSLDSATFAHLLDRADVLITDLDRKGMAEIGATLDRIHREHPRLCIVSITPFGLTGPYCGYQGSELVIQALSGYLGLNGAMGAPPLRAPGHIVGYAVGVNAFVGALAAYIKRERTGWGDLVEVSGIETLASMLPFLGVQYTGADKVREGGTEAGVRLLPCADGWISLMVVNPELKHGLGEILEIPADAWPADLYEGEYAERVEQAVGFLSEYTRRKSTDVIFYALAERGVVCGKLLTPRTLLDEEQLKARSFFRPMTHPELGQLSYPGPPALPSNVDQVAPRPAPGLDEYRDPASLGWEPRASQSVPPSSDTRVELPLAGVRVIDLTQAWIGPFATLLLADLGGEVIKIESHKRPDVWRLASPPIAIPNVKVRRVNRSYYFNSVNHNKRDLALDLRSDEGRKLFLRLVEGADIVAENYTPRVMERFGLDYKVLRAVRPELVMMSASGFGKTGPWSDYKSNGSAIETLAGWDALHCYRSGEPVLMGFYQADAISGLQMAAVTLLCLIRRNNTGEGSAIDGAMLDACAGYIGELILQAQLESEVGPCGNRDPDMAPNGVFPCAGHDRWIAISVRDDAAWRALLTVEGRPPELEAEIFARVAGRLAHQDRLEASLSAWTARCDADALTASLQAAGVAAGVVRTLAEALDDPHLQARDWFKPMTHPNLGTHRYNGFLWRFADCALNPGLPPPRLGEHSEVLLKELLFLDDQEIEALKEKGVTGSVL